MSPRTEAEGERSERVAHGIAGPFSTVKSWKQISPTTPRNMTSIKYPENMFTSSATSVAVPPPSVAATARLASVITPICQAASYLDSDGEEGPQQRLLD